MGNNGTISFQSNDKMDVFHTQEVVEDGIEPSDEELLNIEASQFESNQAWVTGNVPKIKPVHVEGDTSIINAWYKGETFETRFVITVYVECETAEELEEVTADEESDEDKVCDPLEPMEINL